MTDKKITWILPTAALITIGALAYALYQHPKSTQSTPANATPGFTGLLPITANGYAPNNSTTFNSPSYSTQPLTLGAPGSTPLVIPQINVPPITVNNNYAAATCGGCGSF